MLIKVKILLLQIIKKYKNCKYYNQNIIITIFFNIKAVSNRLLGVLILAIFVFGGFLFFQYFFIYNKVELAIYSNVEDYQVNLYVKKLNKSYDYHCASMTCSIQDLPAFEYSYEISKPWYIPKVWSKLLMSWEKTNSIEVTLEKKVLLEPINKEEVSVPAKIEELKKKKSNYVYMQLANGQEIKIKENAIHTLDIYFQEQKIWEIEKVSKSDIQIIPILWSDNFILSIQGESSLYDNLRSKWIELALKVPIIYAKVGDKQNDILLVTQKGTYISDIFTGEIYYFTFFHDFVYFHEGYLWIIFSQDEQRRKNLWLKNLSKNVVYYYNPTTKEKKKVYETSVDIQKIFQEGKRVFVVDREGNQYEIKNV